MKKKNGMKFPDDYGGIKTLNKRIVQKGETREGYAERLHQYIKHKEDPVRSKVRVVTRN